MIDNNQIDEVADTLTYYFGSLTDETSQELFVSMLAEAVTQIIKEHRAISQDIKIGTTH